MKNKLIYVLNSYTSSEASHFAHLAHLLNEIAKIGCEITLIIEKLHARPDTLIPSIRIIGLNNKKPVLRHIELFFLMLRLIREGYTRSFFRINAPACIVGTLAHRILGGKTFLWQSGTTHEWDWAQPFGLKKFRWWLGSYLPNWLARKLTTHFVTGPEKMVEYYHEVVGIPRDKIKLLYNDIEIERFSGLSRTSSRSDYLTKRNLASETIVLLIVHRLSPVRRTTMYLLPLLQALKANQDRHPWCLIIAGGGSEREEAIRITEKTGTTEYVQFLGDVPNRVLPTIYAQADLFLQPSYTEGFPRVMLEAMAAGLPIVSTDAGGTAQLIGPLQADYIVSKDEPDGFAAATLRLMAQRSEWAEIENENLKSVARFSTPAVASMYLEAIFQ